LEIGYPLLDDIDVYVVNNKTTIFSKHTGDQIVFSNRPVQHRNYIFYLPTSEDKLDIYIRVVTKSSVQIPLKLHSVEGFFKKKSENFTVSRVLFWNHPGNDPLQFISLFLIKGMVISPLRPFYV